MDELRTTKGVIVDDAGEAFEYDKIKIYNSWVRYEDEALGWVTLPRENVQAIVEHSTVEEIQSISEKL